jgi:type VI secretion system secreted protein VgrG
VAALANVFQLSVPGAGDVDFRVETVRGRESIHAPFSFEIGCAALERGDDRRAAAADPLAWLGESASLAWEGAGGERTIEGVIEEVASTPPSCRITLVPKLAAGVDAVDHRVFVDQDAVAIAKAILDEHGIAVDARAPSPPKRAQRIQAFEGDLAFVARILADDGIAYFLSEDGKTAILAGGDAGWDDLGRTLPLREEAGLEAGEAVYSARLTRRAVVEEVALRDYDFERPLLDLTARAGDGAKGATRLEYPGGYRDPEAGKALAEARLAELGARRLVLTGETGARGLRPGGVFELEGAARGEMNGRWLVIEIEHAAQEREAGLRTYRARFTAVPAAAGFRPPRTRAPRLGGVQTATVTGPRGVEIHSEEHGRVRLSHRWDRRSPADDTSSAWARTAQPATSGSIFMPRVGWEVLTGFAGDGGDEPLVLGRLDNGQAPPPEGLPAGKIKSALGTSTTPGGGSVNRIATDDTAGSEGMSFVASKAFDERSENDKVTAIKASDTWNIGATSSLRVGTVFQSAVSGSQTFAVGAFRSENVGSNLTYTAASEAVIVGGMRLITAGGDHATSCSVFGRVVAGVEVQLPIEHQTRFVEGGSLVINAGGWLTSAGASAGVAVGGASVLSVGGAMVLEGSTYSLSVKGLLWE